MYEQYQDDDQKFLIQAGYGYLSYHPESYTIYNTEPNFNEGNIFKVSNILKEGKTTKAPVLETWSCFCRKNGLNNDKFMI